MSYKLCMSTADLPLDLMQCRLIAVHERTGGCLQDTEMPTISPDGCEEKCNDPVLVSVVKKHHGWITKVRTHTLAAHRGFHNSLTSLLTV